MSTARLVIIVLLWYTAISIIVVSLWAAFKEVRADARWSKMARKDKRSDDAIIDQMERQWPYDWKERGDFDD